MKQTLLPIAFLLCSIHALIAQPTPALDKVTKLTCECFTKQKDKIKNQADAEKVIGICLFQSGQDKIAALQKELRIKTLNEAGGRKIGEAVGIKLATNCPEFVSKMIAATSITTEDKTKLTATEKSNYIGEIVQVETNGYTFIHIKNEAGRVSKFLWLEYFKGSDAYKQNPQTLVGKNVEIQWQLIEIYDGKLNDYMQVKEIRDLKVE